VAKIHRWHQIEQFSRALASGSERVEHGTHREARRAHHAIVSAR
jgi:hypothetical protein